MTTAANASKTGLAKPRDFTSKDALWRSYENFRLQVIDLINNHEACDGCRSGKNEALSDLGLPIPKTKRRVVLEFDVDLEYMEPDDAADEIVNTINHRMYNETGFRDVEIVKDEAVDN